ncbi:ROK family protein [Bacillus sp. 1P06AnD]|uniref:ROK family protein n=1 Tax=Bacillus sp. 1P06AnD TaxID=3132208 RepID=UPI0039A1F419
MAILVFDIGGTSVKYAIWEKDGLSQNGFFQTPGKWEDMKKQILDVKCKFENQISIDGVAISSPGAVNQEKEWIEGSSAVPYIHQYSIFEELRELLKCPVTIENDANCAALAEVWMGAGKGMKHILFIVIGSGIGGAIITDGELWRGNNLFGGEFGYMMLTEDQTFSDLGTAVGLAKRYEKRKNIPLKSITGKEVFELAEAGDQIAAEEAERFYHYLALGIYNLQYSFDPEKIIIGGGVSSMESLLENLNASLEKIVAKVKIAPFIPDVALCQFKNDANLIGAVKHYLNVKKTNETCKII